MRLIIALFLAITITTQVQADEFRKVNFMVFLKVQHGYEYDPIMFGNFSQFIRAMNGTRLLWLSHSAKTVHGDVINLQQDVLRERNDNTFDDAGVNCQLSFQDHDASGDKAFQLRGDCQIIGRFHNENLTLKAHIPATDLPDAAKGTDVWIELYEDSKSGIAFYANVSK